MVVAAVVDVGVGVDVMAPFSLSFLLLSDCDADGRMDGWTASYNSPVLRNKTKKKNPLQYFIMCCSIHFNSIRSSLSLTC